MSHDEATIARARSFESGAEAYDEFRPGYPEAMFDDVVDHASAVLETGVLDVGAGTGKATLPLAGRGLHVTAVEPSEAMARLLRSRADRACLSERVEVRVAAFEDLGPADGAFGLIVAAQSFHWTEPASRWRRLVDLLAPSGTAALFWNSWHLDSATHDLVAVRRAYERLTPGLVADLPTHEPDSWPADEIEATSGLADAREHSYDWVWVLPTEAYLKLLATTSQYAVTPQPVRAGLFTELNSLLGEQVHLQATTRLHLMRKASGTESQPGAGNEVLTHASLPSGSDRIVYSGRGTSGT